MKTKLFLNVQNGQVFNSAGVFDITQNNQGKQISDTWILNPSIKKEKPLPMTDYCTAYMFHALPDLIVRALQYGYNRTKDERISNMKNRAIKYASYIRKQYSGNNTDLSGYIGQTENSISIEEIYQDCFKAYTELYNLNLLHSPIDFQNYRSYFYKIVNRHVYRITKNKTMLYSDIPKDEEITAEIIIDGILIDSAKHDGTHIDEIEKTEDMITVLSLIEQIVNKRARGANKEKTRAILIMLIVDDMKQNEIAKELNTTAQNINQILKSIRKTAEDFRKEILNNE